MGHSSPLGSIDPLHSNMNALYVQLVEDSLTEFVYPAQLGGLEYSLNALNYGIQVKKSSSPMKNSFAISVNHSWVQP